MFIIRVIDRDWESPEKGIKCLEKPDDGGDQGSGKNPDPTHHIPGGVFVYTPFKNLTSTHPLESTSND